MRYTHPATFALAILLAAASIACDSKSDADSTEETAEATETEEADEAAPKETDEKSEQAKTDSDKVIAVQLAEAEPPAPPEGCQIKQAAPAVLLQCEESGALLGQAIGDNTEGTAQVAIAGMERSWTDAGWKLEKTGTETLSIGDSKVEMTNYKRTRPDVVSNVLAGVVSAPKLDTQRVVSCFSKPGSDIDTEACADHIEFLLDLAASQRVTGISVRGEAVEFGEECVLGQGNVRCGRNVLSWMEYPPTQGEQPNPADKVVSTLRSRGVNIDTKSVPCSLAGESQECRLLTIEIPNNPTQYAVIMDADVDERTVHMTCDIVAPQDPLVLPAACDAMIDVEL